MALYPNMGGSETSYTIETTAVYWKQCTALDPVNSTPPMASLELVHPCRIALATALAAGAYFPFVVNRGSLLGAKTLGSSRSGVSSRGKPPPHGQNQ